MSTARHTGYTLFLIGSAPVIVSITSGTFCASNFWTAAAFFAGLTLMVGSMFGARKARSRPTCTYCGAIHPDDYPCPQLLDACSRRAAQTYKGN